MKTHSIVSSGRISRLPKPVAIFCSTDRIARELVLDCRRAGLAVGDEVALLGVGNVGLDSIFARLPLSSISFPSRRIGYQAAREIRRLIEDPSAEPRSVSLPPGEVFLRDSSLRRGGPDFVVEKALNFIRQNFAQPISVDTLAREAGVSRRSLELHFARAVGRSPYSEIIRHRMAQARMLLSTTDLKVYEVGQRCGYSEPHQFTAAFRKYCGVNPRTFRGRLVRNSNRFPD